MAWLHSIHHDNWVNTKRSPPETIVETYKQFEWSYLKGTILTAVETLTQYSKVPPNLTEFKKNSSNQEYNWTGGQPLLEGMPYHPNIEESRAEPPHKTTCP